MEKNVNNNNVNINRELLNFLETKSYKTLRSLDKDNNNVEFQSDTKNVSPSFSENKAKEIAKDMSLTEANSITKLVTQDDNQEDMIQDSLINLNNEEFVYKTLIFLLNLCKTLNLKEEDMASILNNMKTFLVQNLHQNEEEELESKKFIYLNLKRLLGEDFKTKVLLIKRASTWLGLNKLNNNAEYLNFLTKLSELGDMLSEDQGIKNEQHSFILTKEEAKKQRNSLISDDNFKIALTNKMHPSHRDALNKLRRLNKIIVS